MTEATVNLATESARVTFDATQANDGRLRRAVRDAGYEPREVAAADAAEPSSWQGFAPVAVGLRCLAPLVLPMIGDAVRRALDVAGVDAIPAGDAGAVHSGARFHEAGWHALKALTGNMDLLVAIGTTAGWALSMWLWLTAEPGEMVHLYFEGSAVVVTLVLLGKWLEARAKRRTTTAIRASYRVAARCRAFDRTRQVIRAIARSSNCSTATGSSYAPANAFRQHRVVEEGASEVG